MDFLNIIITLLIPVVLIFGGLMMWKLPAKMNNLIGWRTKASMKSEDNFAYANKYGGRKMFILGIAEFVVTLIAILIFNHPITQLSATIIQAICMYFMIYSVEKHLKDTLNK